MKSQQDNANSFYVTTSIAYTNADPHIGFALESCQADVLARYHRLLGKDTFFLTGTDEHGTKNYRSAKEAGETPKEFTDRISNKFRELADALNISNDDFIRTSDQEKHWPSVEIAWLKLKENGDIYKKKYKGLYCVNCEAFVTEKDLENGKCPLHQKEPEQVEEENYFFKLSKYSQKIKEAIETEKMKIIPEARKNEILSFINEGLEDVSFSRPREKLEWGVPVPDDSEQTIYVWCDALVNYISALGYAENDEKFKKYWPANVHCLGKDILRFHAIIWPAILFSLGLGLPKNILVHGFITVAGQKMSKSLGNIVYPFDLIERYGTDAVRYFLLREIPATEDGDFTGEKFRKRYNSDLAGGIGNLVSRVITMTQKVESNAGVQINNSKSSLTKEFEEKINEVWSKYHKAVESYKFNEALEQIWELIGFCDKYIEKQEPWKFLKSENEEELNKVKEILSNLLFAVSNIDEMVFPFLPQTSKEISKQIDTKSKSRALFPKIEDSE